MMTKYLNKYFVWVACVTKENRESKEDEEEKIPL